MNQQVADVPPHSDNVEEELDRVRRALHTVYSPPQPQQVSVRQPWFEQRALADRYLTSFQSTLTSWMVCDRILQIGSPAEAFFAAQTLQTKCRTQMDQLPLDARPLLRDSLLQQLQHNIGQSALKTRLAMALSALAVQMGWTTIVTDLIGGGASFDRPVVLAILQTLPEECASERLRLSDDRLRYQMRDHLIATSAPVLQYLQTDWSVWHLWIRYVPVPPQVLIESPYLMQCIQSLAQGHNVEATADVLVEVLRLYPSHVPSNEPLMQHLLPLLSQLPLEDALQSEDPDVQRSYCRVVTELAESSLRWLLSPAYPQATKLVEWVLWCAKTPDPELAGMTLHFWYRLVMELELQEPYQWRQELVDVYTPHLLGLMDVCVTNLMVYPDDLDEQPEDVVDELQKHRYYVSETVEDCCRMLGGEQVLQRIGTLLRAEVQRVQGQAHFAWHGVESALSCLCAVKKFVPNDEADLLPYTFQLIAQLPVQIVPLRATTSKVVGAFASWLSVHHEVMQPMLPFLKDGLAIPECAPTAAVAIKELCACSNERLALAQPVLALYQEIASKPDSLGLPEELQILEGVTRALSREAQATGETGQAYLLALVQPIGQRLAAKAADPSSSARKIQPDLERLCVIVQHLTLRWPLTESQPHPLVDLLTSLWPLFDSLVARFPNDYNLAEELCRFHKHALRQCGSEHYAPALDLLLRHLVTSFQVSKQSAFLYAASICITEYGKNPAYHSKLMELIGTLATTTLSSLTTLPDCAAHPDVMEEFFYLVGRMVVYCPDPILQSPLCQSLLQYANMGLQLDHRGANKGIVKFLDHTLATAVSLQQQKDRGTTLASLERVWSDQGGALVGTLSRTLRGELPDYSGQVPELFWKMQVWCPSLLRQWLETALQPYAAKEPLLAALQSGRLSSREDFVLALETFQKNWHRQ